MRIEGIKCEIKYRIRNRECKFAVQVRARAVWSPTRSHDVLRVQLHGLRNAHVHAIIYTCNSVPMDMELEAKEEERTGAVVAGRREVAEVYFQICYERVWLHTLLLSRSI